MRVVFGLGWLLCLVVAAVVCRALYGDGGYVVLGQLDQGIHYIDYDVHRSFASYITQTPGLLGQRLGAQRVTTYAALYAVGVYALPAVLFLAALWLARGTPLLFMATAAAIVVFGFGANFVNTEALLFLAFAWLATVTLALPGPRPALRGFVLPFIACVLLRVYEGMLLAGPVLAAWSFLTSREREGSQEQVGLTIAALLFAIAALIGFSGLVAPRDPGNAASFSTSIFAYLRNPQVFVMLATACAVTAAIVRSGTARIFWTTGSALLAAAFLWKMLRLEGYYAYTLYYYNRTFLVFLLPIAIVAMASIQRFRPRWLSETRATAGAHVMIVPFAAVVAADVLGSARWLDYMRDFCHVLDRPATASTGIEELKRRGAMTGWAWTHPTMSVLLRKQPSQAIVRNDPGQWEPFDPRKMADFKYRGACENPLFGKAGSGIDDGG